MGGQRHAPVAVPPEMTRYPFYRSLGGPQGRSGGCGKSLPHWDTLPVPSIYTECAIPAHRGKAISVQAYSRPTGFPNIGASTFLDNWHKKVVRLSALRTSRLYPQEIFLLLLTVRGWVDAKASHQRKKCQVPEHVSLSTTLERISCKARYLCIITVCCSLVNYVYFAIIVSHFMYWYMPHVNRCNTSSSKFEPGTVTPRMKDDITCISECGNFSGL